jgi:hypothetical protein
MVPVNPHSNPWKPPVKNWTQSNTVQSLVFPLMVCLGIAVLGHAYPEFIADQITVAADGGVVACLGALVWRFTVTKDKLEIRNKPKP